MTQLSRHISAFGGELNKYFDLGPGKIFVDLTLGDGGHTEQALKAGCKVISFDVDPESITRAKNFLDNFASPLIISKGTTPNQKIISEASWIIFQENFVNFSSCLSSIGVHEVDSILIDLGPSQNQILSSHRGFSFDSDELLDMRIDPTLVVTAKDLLNVLNEGELRELFALGGEDYASKIARVICQLRKREPIITCRQLADIITRIKGSRTQGVHPATKVFMALRMAVNSERENIRQVVSKLPQTLAPHGVAGIITFHSGEDGLVKSLLNDLINQGTVIAINKKPIEPSIEELKISKRTRSAKLRLIKKC